MFNKQFFRESLLPLSVLVALLRLQWDPVSQQHRVEIQGIQDIILGESAALTETQFHSWHSTYENEHVHIHPKSMDSGVYSRSIFSELHTLNDRNRFLNLIPSSLEITTLLLDQEDLHPARNLDIPSASHSETAGEISSNSLQTENNSDINVNANGDMNNNNMEVDGAIASPDSGYSEYQDISQEDMDLIEALWRQDIDMGVTREDTFLGKTELELEKPKPVDSSDKLRHNDWQYRIDSETGEHLPISPQEQTPELVPVASNQASPVPDGSLSFEDCLSLLDGFNPETDLPNSRPVPQLVDAVEIEQRWRDLASISELQLTVPEEGSNVTSQNNLQNASWSGSLITDELDVFAYNATTNGNVNLQNATSPQLSMFNNISQPISDNQLLTVDTGDNQIFSGTNDTLMNTSTDLFSPINRLSNMSISAVPSPASSDNSSVNLTMLMMEQQTLELPSTPESSIIITPTPQNNSLLLELLNSREGMADSNEMDSDMQELDSMLNVLEGIDGEDGTPMDLLSEDGSFSGGDTDDSVEGATGFNRDTFKGELKKGYNRGGSSPCHSETGSTSSFDSSQHTDSIHHNHSYASSSEAGSQKNFRSTNSSKNSSSEDDFNRPTRDEKRAKELNIPIPIDKIINLPVDNFNDLLKKYDFNSEQIQLIRDIRRRGKNKVAAQNCRKRKISAIQQVEGTVGSMQNEHDKLLKERDKVKEELAEMRERFDELYNQVFQNMRDRNGDRVDPNQYRLEIMEDGSVILVPRNGTSASGSEHTTDKRFSSN